MNENKFNDKGSVYAKARPDYPKALFDYLENKNIISSDCTVADIGSGTGIFSMQLAPFAEKVFAVEPNDDMRTNAESKFCQLPNIISVKATAENTSLLDGSIDLVTVAQAFHWFDRKAFKTECNRILKPGGKVILVWNNRDESREIIKDNFEVNKKFCRNFKGSSNGIDFSKEGFACFFEGDFDVIEFENSNIYDSDAFVQRNLSSSYAPKASDAGYDEYIEEIRKIFEKHSNGDTVIYPYITRCYIGKTGDA